MVNAVVIYDKSNWLQNMMVHLVQPGDAVLADISEEPPVLAPELIVVAQIENPERYKDQFTVVRIVPPNASLEVFIEVLHLRGFTAIQLAELAYAFAVSGDADTVREAKCIFPTLSAEDAHAMVGRYDGIARLEKLISTGEARISAAKAQFDSGSTIYLDDVIIQVIQGEVPECWGELMGSPSHARDSELMGSPSHARDSELMGSPSHARDSELMGSPSHIAVYVSFDTTQWSPRFTFKSNDSTALSKLLADHDLTESFTDNDLSTEARESLKKLIL
jgi:hypothetical protein